ncbi:MAG TPA: tRNA uridine-5-carboxymethylaminomethyl(34) synthesis GTPase MnmE [Anaerolineae bacterium]|nr:tRNA uridine-5-carboxymethylaminomethyl(34) synthesis GTPase MnmE [Anaerolineae bacterium]HOQ97319.1 tRNA uridine-5-carboxymethylaminomethyl(34) synthesis GTPase MnmE [Anaerolineae bacterium]HOQ97350.1 tRNA uridine-5-carboxymethylaminomethyl(34) synthesis GTPase MnmE [Anaerolineae bacterium]HPL27314.1 tRNA uridine-5-carboxymethylaminomethyl(34) synthesis GTPase MnmE [Anaerolineae bacterium]
MDDTIAAIATPAGEGGIGIIRLSGPEALRIVRRLVVLARASEWQPWRLCYGHVVDPASGAMVDEVLAVCMPAPHTYTRQDVAEIHCHGGPEPLRQVLTLCLQQGARLAEPGEFTLRAFLNGRLDLAQAEAVVDVVRARSRAGLQTAMGQLGGQLSDRVRAVRGGLLEALAHLEAAIDYPGDEIPPCDLPAALAEAAAALDALLAGAERGLAYRQGIRTAIVGRPNVGKSSLLNALLRADRAIVTAIPGTTRDTLEESVVVGDVPLVLVDTAGINDSADPVERLGVARSRAALATAGLALLVVDGSQPPDARDRAIAAELAGREALLVVNKCDLPPATGGEALLPGRRAVRISALTGQGLDALEQALLDTILAGRLQADDTPLVSRPRHVEALRRAREHVDAAACARREGWPDDCVAIDLRAAVAALGEITGETVGEDLVAKIFTDFCIGK